MYHDYQGQPIHIENLKRSCYIQVRLSFIDFTHMYIQNDMVAQKQSMLTQTPSIHHLETQRHKVVIV